MKAAANAAPNVRRYPHAPRSVQTAPRFFERQRSALKKQGRQREQDQHAQIEDRLPSDSENPRQYPSVFTPAIVAPVARFVPRLVLPLRIHITPYRFVDAVDDTAGPDELFVRVLKLLPSP